MLDGGLEVGRVEEGEDGSDIFPFFGDDFPERGGNGVPGEVVVDFGGHEDAV